MSTSINEGIKMLGDSWTLSIIDCLTNKALRFNEIQRAVQGICPVTLADRLKKLEQEMIIKRDKETIDKLSVTYQLTKKGLGVLPILKEIQKFSRNYLNKIGD